VRRTKKIAFGICYYAIAIIALAVADIVIKPTVGTDVLQNGGFETGNLSNWEVVNAGTRMGISTIVSPGHSGNYAVNYSITSIGSGWYELVESVPAIQGTNYTIHFWYKSSVASGQVAFYCYDSEWANMVSQSSAAIQATGDKWTLGSFQISIPSNNQIEHTILSITLGNTIGILIIDDISMEVTSNS
jgi:hypothetical protein